MCEPDKLKAISILKKYVPEASEEELKKIVDLQYSVAEILFEAWKQKLKKSLK